MDMTGWSHGGGSASFSDKHTVMPSGSDGFTSDYLRSESSSGKVKKMSLSFALGDVSETHVTAGVREAFSKLGYGCCRGSAATKSEKLAVMDRHECAQRCEGATGCTSFEINGCNIAADCLGLCYLFFGSGKSLNTQCDTVSGAQICYKRESSDWLHTGKQYAVAFTYRSDGNFTVPKGGLAVADFGSAPTYALTPPVVPNEGAAALYTGTLSVTGAANNAFTIASAAASFFEITGLTILTPAGGAILGDPATAYGSKHAQVEYNLPAFEFDEIVALDPLAQQQVLVGGGAAAAGGGAAAANNALFTPPPTPARTSTTGSQVFSAKDLAEAGRTLRQLMTDDENGNGEAAAGQQQQPQQQQQFVVGVDGGSGEGDGKEFEELGVATTPPSGRVYADSLAAEAVDTWRMENGNWKVGQAGNYATLRVGDFVAPSDGAYQFSLHGSRYTHQSHCVKFFTSTKYHLCGLLEPHKP
jgi:hypothetical protein